MGQAPKPYVKPECTIHPAGSPMYNKIMAVLEAEVTEKQTDCQASNKE